jgi:putative resolvase
MKLSEYAKNMGVSYRTAHRWFQANTIPHKTEQLPSGTILVHIAPEQNTTKVFVYTRVSTYDRKDCLVGQAERCADFAAKRGLVVDKVIKEVASGMNDKRKKLIEMLEARPTHIIIENKDRLTRFGFNYLEILLKQNGCEIVVINRSDSDEVDLMKDMISVVTSFCCRLYGLRRGRSKTKEVKTIITNV